jgi:hypothetical protein
VFVRPRSGDAISFCHELPWSHSISKVNMDLFAFLHSSSPSLYYKFFHSTSRLTSMKATGAMREPALDFDVHHYINRIVTRPRLHLLPRPISWILGYRSQPKPQIGSVLVWLWAFVGAFAGLLVVQAVFQSKGIKVHGAPTVIASFVRRIPQRNNIFVLTFVPGCRCNPRISHN